MDLKLPPIRDLNLPDITRQPTYPTPSQGPVVRHGWRKELLGLCQTLCSLADQYASSPPPPNPPPLAMMVESAVEVITILHEFKKATCPPSAPSRPPKRPWEDANDDVVTPCPVWLPPADRSPSPVPSRSSPSLSKLVSPTQEYHMTVFNPEHNLTMDHNAETIAAHDMEEIRARRGQHNTIVKVMYKKRSGATSFGTCQSCDIQETPEWRRGPAGQRTVCNACGLHFAKLNRKREKTISSLPPGGEAPPPISLTFLRKYARMIAEKSVLPHSSASRCHFANENKNKAKSPVATSPMPPPTSVDVGQRTCELRDKEAEPTPQSTYAVVTYVPTPSNPAHPTMLLPTTLPPPPLTCYAAPGPAMNYGTFFQPYIQSDRILQPFYYPMGPPPDNSWGYNHAHAHHPAGSSLTQHCDDQYMPPYPG